MRRHLIGLALTACFAAGCTVLTDFSDGDELYSIDENLVTPVEVELDGDLGRIELTFQKALPEADDETLAGLLSHGTIDVVVEKTSTGTSYTLTQGMQTEAQPTKPGEYRLQLNDARTTLSVVFFNEFTGAAQLREGEEYEALIDVKANDFFAVDAIPAEVSISRI